MYCKVTLLASTYRFTQQEPLICFIGKGRSNCSSYASYCQNYKVFPAAIQWSNMLHPAKYMSNSPAECTPHHLQNTVSQNHIAKAFELLPAAFAAIVLCAKYIG